MIIEKKLTIIIIVSFGDGNSLYMAAVRTEVTPAFVGAFAVIKKGTKSSFLKSQAIYINVHEEQKTAHILRKAISIK